MNLLKIAGIALIVLGVIIILGSQSAAVYLDDHPRAHTSGGSALGTILIVTGVLLYYLGHLKEKVKGLSLAVNPF